MKLYSSTIILGVYLFFYPISFTHAQLEQDGKVKIHDERFSHGYIELPDSLDSGTWIGYYDNGNLAFRGHYKDKTPEGWFFIYDYYHDSIISEKFEILNGHTVYYEDWRFVPATSSPYKFEEITIDWNSHFEETKKAKTFYSTIHIKTYNTDEKLVGTGMNQTPTSVIKEVMPFFRFHEGIHYLSVLDEEYIYNSCGELELIKKSNNRRKPSCFSPEGLKIDCPKHW